MAEREIWTCKVAATALSTNIQNKAAGLSGNTIVRIAGGNVTAIDDGNTATSELMRLFSEAGSIITRDAAKIMKIDEDIRMEDLRVSGLMGFWEKKG